MAPSSRPQRERVYQTLVTDSSRWDRYAPRPGDIIISTPPKAGTTWTQMICALLVFQRADLDRPLGQISPWLDFRSTDLDETLSSLEAQSHRRFIKTHTPLDGLPYYDEVTYLYCARDPRDVFLSFLNHRDNLTEEWHRRVEAAAGLEVPPPAFPEDPNDLFPSWMTVGHTPWMSDGFPFGSVLYHTRTFWDHRTLPNVYLLHYDDLKTDLSGEMRRLARELDIEVAEELWPALVSSASFESMKERAGRIAPLAELDGWKDDRRFFHKGQTGQWRGVLSPESLAVYEKVMGELSPPPMAAWIQGGRRVTGNPKTL